MTGSEQRDDPATRIVAATRDDIPVILDFLWKLDVIDGEEAEFAATAGNIGEMLFGARPAGEALMAVIAGAPAGMIVFSPILFASDGRGSFYVTKLFVEAAFRGRGIGRDLLAAVQETARGRGLARVVWGAVAHNTRAIDFYLRDGAQEIAGVRWFCTKVGVAD